MSFGQEKRSMKRKMEDDGNDGNEEKKKPDDIKVSVVVQYGTANPGEPEDGELIPLYAKMLVDTYEYTTQCGSCAKEWEDLDEMTMCWEDLLVFEPPICRSCLMGREEETRFFVAQSPPYSDDDHAMNLDEDMN